MFVLSPAPAPPTKCLERQLGCDQLAGPVGSSSSRSPSCSRRSTRSSSLRRPCHRRSGKQRARPERLRRSGSHREAADTRLDPRRCATPEIDARAVRDSRHASGAPTKHREMSTACHRSVRARIRARTWAQIQIHDISIQNV